MADRPGFLSWLRATLSDVNGRAAEHQFEARLDQEIHRAQEELRLAQEQAAAAQADKIHAATRVAALRAQLNELEEQVVRLLKANSTGKARRHASKVADLSAQVREWEMRQSVSQQHAEEKKTLAAFHESVIKRLRRQLGLRRASVNIQRSQEALALFGDTAAITPPSQDTQIVLPETPQQVLDRLRHQAVKGSGSSSPKKAVKRSTKSPSTKSKPTPKGKEK